MRQTNFYGFSGKDEIDKPQKCQNQGQNEFKDAGQNQIFQGTLVILCLHCSESHSTLP